MIVSQIKTKVEDILNKKNISKVFLCEKIGITQQGYYSIFKNNSLKITLLEKIAKVLGVPVGYFFDEKKGSKEIDEFQKQIKNLKELLEFYKDTSFILKSNVQILLMNISEILNNYIFDEKLNTYNSILIDKILSTPSYHNIKHLWTYYIKERSEMEKENLLRYGMQKNETSKEYKERVTKENQKVKELRKKYKDLLP